MTLYIFCLISSRVVVVIWINQRHKKLSFWLQVFFSSLYGLEMVLCLVMYVTFMFLIERYKKHQMIWTTNECSFVLWYLRFINVKLHASLHINDVSNAFNHRNAYALSLFFHIIIRYFKLKYKIKHLMTLNLRIEN